MTLPWTVLRLFCAALVFAVLVACSPDDEGAAPQPSDPDPVDELIELADPLLGRWSGDLEGMIERRQIRVLVPYSRTFYFLDERGSQRGLSFEFMEAFEDFLNEQLGRGHQRVNVIFVPVTRDRLIPWLRDGRGDVIAANLTVTPTRQRQVLFSEPWSRGIDEVLVSGPSAEPVETTDDLAGRTVYVRPHSSYFESLERLNRSFSQRGLERMRLEPAPGHFETGDVLEMVAAGLIDHAVADDYLARLWEQALPDLQVHENIVLRQGAEMAFAVHPESQQLKVKLDEFLRNHRAGTLFGNVTFRRYLENTRWVLEEGRDEAVARFAELADLFREYGDEYDLDWLMLIAQGYQESRLDQSARSPAGAIGVMQLLPTTGAEMGVGDITELENNIHAGARYVRWMIDRYYADAPMDEDNKLLFALASYNAGPRRVREMRREAERVGLDPNIWFDNVETIAARVIGRETVQYVSNIYKYYIAFRLVSRQQRLEVPIIEG
ncbi:lytic transglycosylase F [Wenzhouxiangella sp. AB-CW3]|uniref:transglycosylase SLT domain-containing protein n=1 Tax=Wenzhouxiangella sp. AB-CW3 TaxID=2771012 RepID=UPI00168A5BF1|nr:lytic transglycosylase F [Wenzhouxiangella sp. AB-CW3]QOC21932.1 lytic transglycosylase F [Wenzhouxiangella sp. AB-CW3]